MRWSNAGHPAPLLLKRSGELLKLDATSVPLGLMEDAEYFVTKTQLAPGDKIAIYTDGVSKLKVRLAAF